MNPLSLVRPFILCFVILSQISCNEDSSLKKGKFGGMYEGTFTLVKDSHRYYSSGNDTIVSISESSDDFMAIGKVDNDTYQVMEWESGCNLYLSGAGGHPCTIPFEVSDDEATWVWSSDIQIHLTFKFLHKEDKIEVNYSLNPPQSISVYDNSGAYLYDEEVREYYTFQGTR